MTWCLCSKYHPRITCDRPPSVPCQQSGRKWSQRCSQQIQHMFHYSDKSGPGNTYSSCRLFLFDRILEIYPWHSTKVKAFSKLHPSKQSLINPWRWTSHSNHSNRNHCPYRIYEHLNYHLLGQRLISLWNDFHWAIWSLLSSDLDGVDEPHTRPWLY